MSVDGSTRDRVVVVGSINADMRVEVERFPGPGETLKASGGSLTPGGKGANQALAAARCGARVEMVGAVGSDSSVATALSLLDGSVGLDHVEHREGLTGTAVVMVATSGENSIIIVPAANGTVDADQVRRHAEAIRDADVVVCQGETPADGVAEASGLAARFVLNLAPVIEMDGEVIRRADPLVVNEHEAALAAAMLGSRREGLEEEPQAAAEELLRLGCRSVVLTVGSRGCVVADAHGVVTMPAESVDAVDTVGAGDAFAGALAAELARGCSLVDGCRFATRLATATVTRPGAQASYPSVEEVQQMHGDDEE